MITTKAREWQLDESLVAECRLARDTMKLQVTIIAHEPGTAPDARLVRETCLDAASAPTTVEEFADTVFTALSKLFCNGISMIVVATASSHGTITLRL